MYQQRINRYHCVLYSNLWTPLPAPNGTWAYASSGSSMNTISSRSGGSLANWRAIIAAGNNATTSFTGVRQFVTITPGNCYYETRSLSGVLTRKGYNWGVFNKPACGAPAGSMSATDSLARQGTLKRIKETRTYFQGSIFLGEMKESLRMIASPAKALRKGLSDYLASAGKRTSRMPTRTSKQRKSVSNVLGDTWLEYSFGWVPLVNDIDSAHKAYYKHLHRAPMNRVSYTAATDSLVEASSEQAYQGSFPVIMSMTSINTKQVRYRVGLKTNNQGASYQPSNFEKAGLTLSEFAPTLWELLPWSFLVDYFTNIGDIIAAGATSTSSVKWVCVTSRHTNARVRKLVLDYKRAITDSPGVVHTISGDPGSWTANHVIVTRSAGSLSAPDFRVEIPGNPIQWINMAALGATSRKLSSRFIN